MYTHEIVSKVKSLLSEGSSKGTRVSAWEAIQAELVQAGLAWTAQVPPDFVGVHPSNRSHLGVGGSEAHWHGAQVLQAGFSWAKAADATAIEAPPPPHDNEAVAANAKYVSLSDGLIPPLSQMKLLSIGGGHTNVFLRSVKAGTRSAVDKLADASGKLNLEHLAVGRPAFREAVEHGLKWFVLHWQAPEVWPELVHFAQSALNTVARNEQGELEVMLELHRLWRLDVESHREPNWQKIQETACLSMPPCTQYIGSLVAFVKANSGGVDGTLLDELSSFQKMFACSESGATRRMGSEFFHKLSGLTFGPGEKYPYIMNACIAANLIAPKVIDGICRLLGSPQLQLLTNKATKPKVKEAEELMVNVREVCSRLNVPQAIKTKVVGKVDVRCILLLCNKLKEVEKITLETIADVAQMFVKDLADNGFDHDLIKAVISQPESPQSSCGPAQVADIPETVAQMKSMAYQATKLGLGVGAVVVLKQDTDASRIFTVKAISDVEGVVLASRGHPDAKVPADTYLTTYKVLKGKAESVLQHLEVGIPHQSEAWGWDIVRGILGFAVRGEFMKHKSCLESVQLFVNPASTKATVAVKKGELIIVAASARFDTKPSSPSAVNCGSYAIVEGCKPTVVYVLPHFIQPIAKNGEPNKMPFVSPFWHTRCVAEAKQANMELSWYHVTVEGIVCNVPFMINKRDVKPDEELILHFVQSMHPKGAAPARKMHPKDAAPARKKARR